MARQLPNLDLLRAVAVLMVVVDHTLKFFGLKSIGYVSLNALGAAGVFIFFVHTSLVLMLSLERLQASYGRAGLAINFLIRRAFRIYPLSVLVVACLLIFEIPSQQILGPGQIALAHPSPASIASNLALTMNLTRHTPVLGPLWSLPLELQMYLFLPLLFLLVPRLRAWGVLGLWAAGVAISFVQPAISPRLNLVQYVPQFLPGILAYTLWRNRRTQLPGWAWPCFLLVAFSAHFLFPGRRPAWWMCLVLGAGIPFFRQLQHRGTTAVAHQIAKYSYGIYLAHMFSIWLAFSKLGALPFAVQGLAFLAALALLPVILYHLIEAPGIRMGISLGDMVCRWLGPSGLKKASTGREVCPTRIASC